MQDSDWKIKLDKVFSSVGTISLLLGLAADKNRAFNGKFRQMGSSSAFLADEIWLFQYKLQTMLKHSDDYPVVKVVQPKQADALGPRLMAAVSLKH